MTPPPRHRIGVTAALVLATLLAGTPPATADQIEVKQAEASAVANKLAEQADQIVQTDIEYRRAKDAMDDAQAAIEQAETEMAAAARRQTDIKRLLASQAQDAYVLGGSVSVLRYLIRTNHDNAVARRAYLRIVTGQDRQILGQLKAVREDLADKRARLGAARQKARAEAEALAADRNALDRIIGAQRALLSQVNGELASLVAAEQARRDAELARQAAGSRPAPVPAGGGGGGGGGGGARAPAAALPVVPSAPVADTFACIRQLESGNNYSTPGGGAYQFLDSTWQALGYSGTASNASPAQQDQAALKLQSEEGWSPWTTAPLCGRA